MYDRAEIPNPRAASYDRHRVIRALHPRDPAATAAAVRAHGRWTDLQDLLSAQFYSQVGALTALPPNELPRARAMVTAVAAPAHVLGPDELASRYPHIRFPAGGGAILESLAGVLLADRILAACASWLDRHPRAALHPHREAAGVDPHGPAVRFVGGDEVAADAVLVAAGPWSRALLAPEIAGELALYRQSMLYCEVPAAAAAGWSVTPPMLALGADGGAWLVPPVAGTPLKLSAASACRVVAEVGDTTTTPYWRDHLIDTFSGVIAGFRADWVTDARDCYYLARADAGGAMLVALGRSVLSYAACGGSSFKFAPLIARSLIERLTGADPAPTGLEALDGAIVPVPSERTVGTRRPAH
jgi:hypothetical protein